MADIFTGVLFSKTAPRTPRHLFLFRVEMYLEFMIGWMGSGWEEKRLRDSGARNWSAYERTLWDQISYLWDYSWRKTLFFGGRECTDALQAWSLANLPLARVDIGFLQWDFVHRRYLLTCRTPFTALYLTWSFPLHLTGLTQQVHILSGPSFLPLLSSFFSQRFLCFIHSSNTSSVKMERAPRGKDRSIRT